MNFSTATTTILLFCVGLLCNCVDQATAQNKQNKNATHIPDIKDADANSDGKVTTEELKAFLNARYVDEWVKKIDANGNGKISRYELRLIRKALTRVLDEQGEAAKAAASNMENASSIDMMDNGFRKQRPLLGTTIEGLTVLSENGEETDFNSFRGKHVVLVFGCLT